MFDIQIKQAINQIKPGKYVIAVSGGVDSVVLLDLLAKRGRLDLIVAHFDHGIRPDSYKDREFTQDLANKYQLPFEFEEGKLGLGASEELARQTRYEFLHNICKKYHTDRVVTAHHKDDAIETLIINIIRGTQRRGLSSLSSSEDVIRPLLPYSKKQIIEYAKKNNLGWREDPTNLEVQFLRNYVRNILIPNASNKDPEVTEKLYKISRKMLTLNEEIDKELESSIKPKVATCQNSVKLPRYFFIMLPKPVALEVFYYLARSILPYQHVGTRLAQKAVFFAKTGRIGKRMDLSENLTLAIAKGAICLSKTP